jgi:arylsulfatase A-like enzyme
MREEFYQYYCTVKRLDYTFREIMKLVEPGLAIFTSDHGMSFPFVKGNCYHYSTNIPLIIGGDRLLRRTDDRHLVSHVDITPTVLDYLGISHRCDGVSYLDLLTKGEQPGLDYVYSQLNAMFSGPAIHIRAITSRDHCYVVNIDNDYPAGNVDGWGWHNSVAALPKDCLHRLISRPNEELFVINEQSSETKRELRQTLFAKMKQFKDPLLKQAVMKTIGVL